MTEPRQKNWNQTNFAIKYGHYAQIATFNGIESL
jgi:hypothetical protein